MDNLNGPADGETFDPDKDQNRLNLQRQRVWAVMSDHQWHTSRELEERVGDSWASVGARMRDFRKPRYGSHEVLRRRVLDVKGLWEYRLLPPPDVTIRDAQLRLREAVSHHPSRGVASM